MGAGDRRPGAPAASRGSRHPPPEPPRGARPWAAWISGSQLQSPRGWLPAALSPSQPPSPCRGVFAVAAGHQHQLLTSPHHGMFSSVAQSCLTLCDLRTTACQASLSITNSWSLLKLMCIESVMPSSPLILCHPLLLPSVFPSTRVCLLSSVQNQD